MARWQHATLWNLTGGVFDSFQIFSPIPFPTEYTLVFTLPLLLPFLSFPSSLQPFCLPLNQNNVGLYLSLDCMFTLWPRMKSHREYIRFYLCISRWKAVRVPFVWQSLQSVVQPHHAQPKTHGTQAFRLSSLRQGVPAQGRRPPPSWSQTSGRPSGRERDWSAKATRRCTRNSYRGFIHSKNFRLPPAFWVPKLCNVTMVQGSRRLRRRQGHGFVGEVKGPGC